MKLTEDAAAGAAGAEDAPTGDTAPAEATAPAPGAQAGDTAPAGRRRLAVLVLAVMAAALAALAVALGVSYQHARDRAAAQTAALGPAKAAAARILSYDYRHIEQDAAQTVAVLTGDFRGQYETVMRQQIAPQAPAQRAVVQAEVLSAGVTSVNGDGTQAVVLVFANQTVSNQATPQPRVDQVRVRLTLDRVGDAWLVSKVDAI